MHKSNSHEMPSYLLPLAITSLQTSGGGTGSTSQITNLSLSNGDAEHDNGAALGEGCDHVALVYQKEVMSTYYSER